MTITREVEREPGAEPFARAAIFTPALFVPLEQILRQSFQRNRFAFENFQRAKRAVGELFRDFAGFFQADHRRISRLLRVGIFAGGFAELLAGLRHVEDVVDDLKGEADVIAEIGQCLQVARPCNWRSCRPAERSSRAAPKFCARECI